MPARDRRRSPGPDPHPEALGSALTNEQITTDYSESLLEFITPALADPAKVLESLEQTHRFVYSKLGDEYLWSPSMPCPLPAEEDIPIAEYGTSNIGKLKHVYRKGLALRYGRTMQCIAGIHYNFSLPEALWPLRAEEGSAGRPRLPVVGLHRADPQLPPLQLAADVPVRRLAGAGQRLPARPPAPARRARRRHPVPALRHQPAHERPGLPEQRPGRPDAVLQQPASYTDSLRKAVGTPYPPYVEVGTHKDGEWVQLNTNILQIENEYYSNIRPKRVTYTGERPIQALMARGVQYVEVRCLDINPFLPVGIDLTEARFLDAFLLFCALDDSPQLDNGECGQCTSNFLTVVKEGRRPGLRCSATASRSPEGLGQRADRAYRPDGRAARPVPKAASTPRPWMPSRPRSTTLLTPSAQVLARMTEHDESFVQFSLRQSRVHAETFREQPLSSEKQQAFETLARESLARQSSWSRRSR
jgi:glutamate--cysteine ligase